MVEAKTEQEYVIPFSYQKVFSVEDRSEVTRAFKSYDKDRSGTMDGKEFKMLCKDLGHDEITQE